MPAACSPRPPAWIPTVIAVVGLLLVSTLTPPASMAQAASTVPPLGMDVGSASALQSAGAAPRYGSYWVGQWMATSGWGGLDGALATAVSTGTTPVLYWYYWGDSISSSCIENGCNGKSQAQWTSMTSTLADRVRADMGGRETLIVLENEFNKADITGSYAPTFDAKLAAVASTLKAVPGVKLVLGFGGWGEGAWSEFPQSAAQSDYIGFQTMRASTRDTEASYRGASDRVAYFTQLIAQTFHKPSFLYDLALSSYPDASWEAIQAQTLSAIFANLTTSGATGLQGVVYRSLVDTYMDPSNYYGAAESYWGLKRSDGAAKPAWSAWLSVAAAPAPNVPGSFEAEAMQASTGARQADSNASGGAVWNVWANGTLAQGLVSAGGDYTITVLARGSPALGIDPRMDVRVGGATLGSFSVPSGALRPYVVNATLPNGSSSLTLAFTNDLRTSTEDRNLYVDVVRVAPMDHPPVARIAASATDLTVSVDASASSDPDGDALAYAWSFGDGATATGVRASHAYASAGTYTVTLTASDGQLSSRASAAVTAIQPNRAPMASFSVSGANLTWSFDGRASSDPDGDALSYAWSFGDGATATGATATHAYAGAGSYAVTLRVDDGHGGSANATRTLATTRPDRAPSAAISVSGANMTWTFSAAGSSDPDGDPLAYAWSFSDGFAASGVSVTRTFASAGSYSATVTASDGTLSSSAGAFVRAAYPAPTASFTAAGGGSVWTFDASASTSPAPGALSYAWDFGDGAKGSGVNVTHAYAAAGAYDVTLTVTDSQPTQNSGTARQSVTAAPFAAAFSTHGGNAWWIAASVSANEPLRSVCASVNGGACQALKLQSWGEWAASYSAPDGSRVVFTATSAAGHVASSVTYVWPTGLPLFSATFSGVSGNNWWEQVNVAANQTLSGVCVSVNGGTCQALKLQSWGGWAGSFYAPTGSRVTFTATSTSGQTVTSAAYKWSSKV